jgi:hypothetical protein
MALVVAGASLAATQAGAQPRNFAPITDGAYLKECGTSCHMALPPELLPARSWRKVMASLAEHFGESAQVDAAMHQRITDYLVAHAADQARNAQSMAVMASLKADEAPLRITQTPYVGGMHAVVLDPLWGGDPRPKTLVECNVCHVNSERGVYTERRFSVSDAAFRPQGR